MNNQEFIDAVTSAWKEVFASSRISARTLPFGGGVGVTGMLSGSNDECANGISHNDPLNYGGFYDEGEGYKEEAASVYVHPAPGSFNALGTVKLRKVTIKNPTREKLVARFTVLRNMLIDNVDRIHHAPELVVARKLGL